jgi:hypothetical protein
LGNRRVGRRVVRALLGVTQATGGEDADGHQHCEDQKLLHG